MQKSLTQFKSVINGIESFFHFDAACPIGTAKDAILECLKWIGQIEDAQKAAAAAVASPPAPAPTEPVAQEPTNG